MICPKCKLNMACGCQSCIDKDTKQILKPFLWVNGDYTECPYCKEITHYEALVDFNYRHVEILK